MPEFYDVVATILTFITFGVMFFGLAIVVLIKNVKKNWPKYKCNPAIIPFVGLLAKMLLLILAMYLIYKKVIWIFS